MKKLTILIDMDDVLENLITCWVNELNRLHGTSVDVSEITDWRMILFFPSLTKEEVFEPLFDPALWKSLDPIQNAPDVVKQLIDDGHTVRVVTASHYNTVPPKVKRFIEMYPYLKWEDIIIASDKKLVQGDVLIDDGVHNLVDFPATRILFDRPHNRSFPAEDNNMIRVSTWDEIYSVITTMAQEE